MSRCSTALERPERRNPVVRGGKTALTVYSYNQAAAITGLARRTLERLIESGQGPAVVELSPRRRGTFLRKAGVSVGFRREGKKGSRTITISAIKSDPSNREGNSPSEPSAPSVPLFSNGLEADGLADAPDRTVSRTVSPNPLKSQVADSADSADGQTPYPSIDEEDQPPDRMQI